MTATAAESTEGSAGSARRRLGAALACGLGLAACGGGGDDPIVPVQIADLAAVPDDAAVLLTWSVQSTQVEHVLYWSLTPGVDPATASELVGVSPPFLHEGLQNDVAVHYAILARAGGTVGPLSAEQSATPSRFGDPLFKDQWNLENTGQMSGVPGEDAGLVAAWDMGREGDGTVIAIVDDGLELHHEDLVSNVLFGQSHDYVGGGTDPTGGEHGTSCAGIAAARGHNGRGVRGAAPRAKLVGFNFLADSTVANQADAMVRGLEHVDVSSNSWGPPDGTGDLGPSTAPWRDAIANGLANGRGGLGTIYVIAAGNGHLGGGPGPHGVSDGSNYNAFATVDGVIAVGAVDDRGRRAEYSERGANLLVCAPSARSGAPPSPLNQKISTTDRSGASGYNAEGTPLEYPDRSYTKAFDGTSASTPTVAGVAALVLQENPGLGWRDLREVLALSARRNDPGHADWARNPAGHWVNHDYGFGVVDAGAAVAMAGGWANAGPRVVRQSARIEPDLPIPDADPTGVAVVVPMTGSGIAHIEHVDVVLSSDHPFTPDLRVVLVSPVPGPDGEFVSVLSEPHDTTVATPQRYQGWRFGTERHLGQAADGDWILRVSDHAAEDVGRIESVQLVFFGR